METLITIVIIVSHRKFTSPCIMDFSSNSLPQNGKPHDAQSGSPKVEHRDISQRVDWWQVQCGRYNVVINFKGSGFNIDRAVLRRGGYSIDPRWNNVFRFRGSVFVRQILVWNEHTVHIRLTETEFRLLYIQSSKSTLHFFQCFPSFLERQDWFPH